MMRLIILLFFFCFSTFVGTVRCQQMHSQEDGKKPKAHYNSFRAAPPRFSILVGLRQRLRTATSSQQKANVLFELSEAYSYMLKIDSALMYSKQIKVIADNSGDEIILATHYLANGIAHSFRNSAELALFELNRAMAYFNETKNTYFKGLSYFHMARQLSLQRKYNETLKFYRMALPYIIAIGDKSRIQQTKYNFGRSFLLAMELDSAVFYLAGAAVLAEELKLPQRQFNSLSMLGAAQLLAGNLSEAERFLRSAIQLEPTTTDKVHLRVVLVDYAETLILQKKSELTKPILLKLALLNNTLKDAWGKMMQLQLEGLLYYESGNYPEALKKFSEAYLLRSSSINYHNDISSIPLNLGRAELKLAMPDIGIVHLTEARQAAIKSNHVSGIMDANFLLAEAYNYKNNADSAYLYFRRYSYLKDSILSRQKEKTVMELNAKYAADKREQQIKNLETQKKLFEFEALLQNKTIEQQNLIGLKSTQQFILLQQESEINRLTASEKGLALLGREKEFAKNQKELNLLQKEKQLQSALAENELQQKKLLFIIAIGIFLFLMYGAYRYRQNNLLSSRLAKSLVDLKQAQDQLVKTEKEKESENVRLRISRDIHDEVGATLSGVALFSEIAKQKINEQKGEETLEYLNHISSNSKEMVEKISDIVWAINPVNDSFQKLTEKLRSYILKLCVGKGVELHFEIDEVLKKSMPSMDFRRNIYLFSKEAINNAIKYSCCSRFLFALKEDGAYGSLKIQDNGIGFEAERESLGNGLKNMYARAKEMNADCSVTSSPDTGTLIELRFKFHPNG